MGKRRSLGTGYLIIILLVFSFPSFAKTIAPLSASTQISTHETTSAEVKPKESQVENRKKHGSELLFDTQISAITYKEPGIMTESGLMVGFLGGYKYHSDIGLMFGFDGRMATGYVNYDGSLMDGTPFKVSSVPDALYETKGVIGIDVPMNKGLALTIYYGLGYRCLEDNLQSVYAGGYFRQANYYYYPLGIECSWDIARGTSLGLMAESDVFSHGRQLSKMNQADRSVPDFVNEQNTGYGYKWALMFRTMADNMDMVFKLFQNYWSIEQSEIATYYAGGILQPMIEPKNNSSETGFSFGIIF